MDVPNESEAFLLNVANFDDDLEISSNVNQSLCSDWIASSILNEIIDRAVQTKLEERANIKNVTGSFIEEHYDISDDDNKEQRTQPNKKKKNYPKKQEFCYFCKLLKTNIARHFEMAHCGEKGGEKEV